MKAWGVNAVIGESFARIFFRNCINLGLPAIVSPEAVSASRDGSTIRITPETGRVEVEDTVFETNPLPPFIIDIFEIGGLEAWVERRIEDRRLT